MARTITAIATTIKEAFMASSTLQSLYGFAGTDGFDEKFSSVSIEAILINIVSTVAAAVENMFDWHKADVEELINNERIGKKGWYEEKAEAFQYGYELPEGSDTYADTTSVEALTAQIVNSAWAGEYGTNGVKLKVAKVTDSILEPLTTEELLAFTAYMNRIKPAGIAMNIVSEAADRLGIEVDIYYDALVMNADGTLISGGRNTVEDAIIGYLNSLEFNGEFVTMYLCDTIQSAAGVKVVEIKSVSYKHVGYDFVAIDAKYTPESGYLAFDATDTAHVTINYIANV